MGLASALTTALTGLTAAETQIDVVGNNLANSQTVGFKASTTLFATQFLQTLGLGSAPTTTSGGTDPRQTGLGVQVAQISPNFAQGTVQISSSPSDLAIQGDGFFMLQNSAGEKVFSRNGQFKTNSDNELVNTTGNRLLGYGVDSNYTIQTTTLVALKIPLGSARVAQATQNVFMQGTFTPTGDIADTAEVIQSAILGDALKPRPDQTNIDINVTTVPDTSAVTVTHSEGGVGTFAEGGVYQYKLVFADSFGTESNSSSTINVTIPAGNAAADNTVVLGNLPTSSNYSSVNIYRTGPGGTSFFKVGSAATGGSFTDTNIALSATALDTSTLSGNYSYVITYYKAGEQESRPSQIIGPQNVQGGRIQLSNFPTPPTPPVTGGFPAYDKIRIYRNTKTDSSTYYLVDTVNPTDSYTDVKTDAQISNLATSGNQKLDADGPKLDSNTLLVNVLRRSNFDYEQVFTEGTLSFQGRKGGRQLSAKDFSITSTSTVQDLVDFMSQAMGIQTTNDDPQNPIPGSLNNIAGETAALSPGATIQDGKIRFISNNGIDNALSIDLSSFQLTATVGGLTTPNLGFGSIQTAKGQSAATDFVAYDSLGIPVNVRVTVDLQSTSGGATTYRWFADSPDNQPLAGNRINVGTGLVTFDGIGNFVSATNDTVSIDRRDVPSATPLEFKLDFSQVSGLASSKASVAAARQDGSASGTLTSFIIGEDGIIRGVFSNGVTRDLGSVRLARFSNNGGLEQRGENLYAQGVNSGLPVEGNPGEQGIGSIKSGAVELSNTDIGRNLIELVLATTQYRGNTRVITTSQQLFDELLNLRR